MNQVNLIGRVGGDIDIRQTSGGKSVAELNLAVDDGFGENKKTVWVGVTLWGATADCAAKYVKKGDRLGISGRLSQDSWEDKTTGKKQTKTKVTCENMHLITDKSKDGYREPQGARSSEYGKPEQRSASQNGAKPPANVPDDDDGDTIPF